MPELAEDARRVLAASYPDSARRVAQDARDPWYKFW
jgi:hypothetical protein